MKSRHDVAVQPVGTTYDTPAVRMIKKGLEWKMAIADPRLVMSQSEWNNPEKIEKTRADMREVLRDHVGYIDLMRDYSRAFGKAF